MAAKKPVIYRIHPAVGFARVGAGSQFFIGPEVPGYGATGADAGVGSGVPPFKQSTGTLKRQAARFRVWRYTWDNGQRKYVPDTDDLTSPAAKIKWTVELANRKASFYEFHGTNGEDPATNFNPRKRNKRVTAGREAKLEMNPPPKSIAGVSKGPEKFDVATPGIPITYLGELLTDNKGRLIVLGGRGESKPSAALATGGLVHPVPLGHYANNPTWFDDVADGPVTAEIEVSGVKIPWSEVEPAWVIVGPPDFAPGLRNVVSLYDRLVDVWVRNGTLDVSGASSAPTWMRDMRLDFTATSGFTNFRPDFTRDVYPLLQAVMNYRWVHAPAQAFHYYWDWAKLSDSSPAAAAERKRIYDRLRVPPSLTSLPSSASATMPKLIGDEEIDENSSAPLNEDGIADAGAPRRPPSTQPGSKSWLTVTAVQYAVIRQWMLGKFDKGIWPGSNKPSDLPAPPTLITPWGLDVAQLENCVGGAFFPGIEVSWLIRNPRLYEVPNGQTSVFRINPWRRRTDGTVMTNAAGKPILRKVHYGSTAGGEDLSLRAGFFTQQMALPWQADFMSCLKTMHLGVADAGWWPAQRPDDVYVTPFSVPLSAAALTAFNPSVGMQEWLGSTAASAVLFVPVTPARDGSITTRERLVEHFQKLGFLRAADAVGERRSNRNTVYFEQERDAIPP
jgi:L-Lysine epsilon oxidase N-terminal/L-lysine epsilon oxidase C-terminal domain